MLVGEVNYEDLFYGNEKNPADDFFLFACMFNSYNFYNYLIYICDF